jgi:hypothetical protein
LTRVQRRNNNRNRKIKSTKKGKNEEWSVTRSGFMRETRSEGCQLGKIVSGTAVIRDCGGAAEVRREALKREGVLECEFENARLLLL